MSERAALERRLADLKAELGRVEGRPTEVYSRIVGYYRSVRNWNAGKREEYGHRRTFGIATAGGTETALSLPSIPAPAAAVAAPSGAGEFLWSHHEGDGLMLFTRKSCPNCPPMKDFVARAGLKAILVDVDAEEGLALARRHNVLSTPTVIGIDLEGRESFRARNLAELRERVGVAPALA